MSKSSHLRRFEKEFPKAAREVGYSTHINIIYRNKAFWLNNEVQLTGYKLGEKGEPLSKDDNESIAIRRIKQFKDGVAALEKETLVERFSRLVNEAKALRPVWRNFVTYRHPGGDTATILNNGDLWVRFTGIDYGIQATGKKNRQEAINDCAIQFEKYTGATTNIQEEI